jgi:cathepsin L
MKTFALAAVAATAAATELTAANMAFVRYIAEFNKFYNTTEEFKFRQQIFEEAHEQIEAHNAEGNTWTLGHNQFSDWHADEYKVLLGYKPELRTAQYQDIAPTPFTPTNADSVNWVTAGAVTPVKDQGSCGSCWSFSTTGALEGAHFIASGNLESYSEMQFVDCDYGLTKNLGCNGGLMDKAFTYAETNAITTEEAYPYVPKHSSCDSSKLAGASLKVSSFVDVEVNNVEALKAQLVKGPVSVAIEADKLVFQRYKTGVITGPKCGTNLDHGVLAVGFGTEDGTDYFLVKNSWNSSWGDNGYVKIGQVSDAPEGVCGILSGPPSQPVTN